MRSLLEIVAGEAEPGCRIGERILAAQRDELVLRSMASPNWRSGDITTRATMAIIRRARPPPPAGRE